MKKHSDGTGFGSQQDVKIAALFLQLAYAIQWVMRGKDHQQSQMFSYLSPETRVRKGRPLRAIRAMVDEVLTQLSRRFDTMYAASGRPSIQVMTISISSPNAGTCESGRI